MQHPAWTLVSIGVVLGLVGLAWLIAPSIPWLGRLPGDLRIEGESFRLYLPLTSSILVSVVLTGVLWLVRFFTR